MKARRTSLAALVLATCASAMAWGAALTPAEMSVLGERDPRYAMPEPSPAAQALAAKIGSEGNIDGFRALAHLRNASLLHRAAASYEANAPKVLPAELQTLIVVHYADEPVRRGLTALLARKMDKYERYPKYSDRELFDLLYADLKAGKDPLHHAIRIVATDLKDVEQDLTGLLPSLNAESANEIVMFLGTRKYAPAVPALKALQQRIPLEHNVNQALEHTNWALLQIGTPDAVQAVLDRLRFLGQSADPRAASEVWAALLNLTALPPGSPPDYAELRAALPAVLNRSSWDQLVKLIETRKEKRGIPDLMLAMTKAPESDAAINALLSMGEPADWRAAREQLGRSSTGMAPERLAVLQKRLDDALESPARFLAQRQERERQQELRAGQQRFREEKNRLAPLRAKAPERYAAAWRALIEKHEAQLRAHADLPASTGSRGDVAREYSALAAFLRYTLRQPDEAIVVYQAASKSRGVLPNNVDLVALAIADIQRFDKRDAPKAIEQYRIALASLEKAVATLRSEDAYAWAGLRRWLGHEIAFLQTGKPFSGAVEREDMGVVQVWLLLATGLQEMSPALQDAITRGREAAVRGDTAWAAATEIRRVLEALPASQFHLANAYAGVFQLPPAAMLRFFAKHDPTGYLTAALLALTTDPRMQRGAVFGHEGWLLGSPAAAKSAADTFFRNRGIRGPAAPDARYATPEKTWALLLASAKKGDAAAMLACFTADMRAKMQDLFTRMSPEALRKMAESFAGFAMQSRGEQHGDAFVTRQSGEKRMAGFVQFVNEGGEWKIDSM